MARPFKSGVDYLPLDVFPDDKVKLLEAKHKITGFGVWVKLLQKIYSSGYWIEWNEDLKILFSNDINVDINVINDIINSCLHWKIFDKNMFDNFSVLTSRGIQKRYFDITRIARRKKIEIVERYLLIDIDINDDIYCVIDVNNSIKTSDSTQRKGKERKGKENIISKPDSVTDQTWNDFLSHRKKKKADITKTALNKIISQADKAGWTIENALIEIITRGWTGFNADWVQDKSKKVIHEY